MEACRFGRPAVVRQLLYHSPPPGVNVNSTDGERRTALHHACANSSPAHEECRQLLLATPGIDVHIRDVKGKAPLELL
jgi:ankyrin repeat protein